MGTGVPPLHFNNTLLLLSCTGLSRNNNFVTSWMDPQPQEMAREIIMLLGHHQCGRKNAFHSLKKRRIIIIIMNAFLN